jgi:hypothetical protein
MDIPGVATASVKEGPSGPPITMAFPCYAGPTLRELTTVLLYREKIHVSIPMLFDEQQYVVFRAAGDHAQKNGHSCFEAFALAHDRFMLAVNQAVAERRALAPLGDHFEFMQIVNDGSPKWYDHALKSIDPERFAAMEAALGDEQQFNVAGREFLWRVFSAYLEFDNDIASVVEHIEQSLLRRGSAAGLLAESLLNRYMLVGGGPSRMALATADARAARVLAVLAEERASQEMSAQSRSDLLAFMFFDELLREHVGSLVAPNIERVAKLFADRGRELRAMRERCQREAVQLVGDVPAPNMLVRRATDTLEAFREEVSALLDLNRAAFAKTIRGVTENGGFWTSLLVVLGAALDIGSLPAALAAGALGQVGASATKAWNERRDLLKDSPWSFVYFARRAG